MFFCKQKSPLKRAFLFVPLYQSRGTVEVRCRPKATGDIEEKGADGLTVHRSFGHAALASAMSSGVSSSSSLDGPPNPLGGLQMRL